MDVVDTPRKAVISNFRSRVKNMDVMEPIEEVMEVVKIAALNLWATDRKRSNIAIDECMQKMKDIRSLANQDKLRQHRNSFSLHGGTDGDQLRHSYEQRCARCRKRNVK